MLNKLLNIIFDQIFAIAILLTKLYIKIETKITQSFCKHKNLDHNDVCWYCLKEC